MNGRTLMVKNTGHADGASAIHFSFRDPLEGVGYFLLPHQGYEEADYVLIHGRSGSRFPLQGLPAISLDEPPPGGSSGSVQ